MTLAPTSLSKIGFVLSGTLAQSILFVLQLVHFEVAYGGAVLKKHHLTFHLFSVAPLAMPRGRPSLQAPVAENVGGYINVNTSDFIITNAPA